MHIDHTKRQVHLALYSPLDLEDFCSKFKNSLGLPEMHFDAENETEWGLIEFRNIEYSVSRPYKKGTLQEWDDSTPFDCNFGITLSIHKNHPSANDTEWINHNLVSIVANRLASTFETPVHYHRSWLGVGKNETKKIIFTTKYNMKLSNSFSGALRTFAYMMASGTQDTLKGVDYLSLYGEEPSAIEQVFAIYANIIELDENGNVLNAKYAEKRATDYLKQYCDPNFKVEPKYEDWETELHNPPPINDLI